MKPIEWIRGTAIRTPKFEPYSSDTVVDFYTWYCVCGSALPMPPPDALHFHGGNLPGLVLYRSGQFQIQLFLFPPGTIVPEHRHPKVDTVEAYVAGDSDFRVAGVPSVPLDHLHDRRDGASRWWNRGVRVPPDTMHELHVGNAGASFLSFQRWLSGIKPTSVGHNWEGSPVNLQHGEVIKCGE